jgi:hypothetical protein
MTYNLGQDLAAAAKQNHAPYGIDQQLDACAALLIETAQEFLSDTAIAAHLERKICEAHKTNDRLAWVVYYYALEQVDSKQLPISYLFYTACVRDVAN